MGAIAMVGVAIRILEVFRRVVEQRRAATVMASNALAVSARDPGNAWAPRQRRPRIPVAVPAPMFFGS